MAKRGERLAFNGWVEAAAELSRRRGLLSSFMPKPRAMRRAWWWRGSGMVMAWE